MKHKTKKRLYSKIVSVALGGCAYVGFRVPSTIFLIKNREMNEFLIKKGDLSKISQNRLKSS